MNETLLKKADIALLKAAEALNRECTYTPIESNIPYPRKEYKCSCGFQYALMESEVWDGKEYIKQIPKGYCMKCSRPILVKETPCDNSK